ncbi:unnamed protein product [Sympodiomycopsis kandeliae]
MGFEDRSDSFDFNVSLQDWVKRQRHAESSNSNGTEQADTSEAASSLPSPHIPKDGPKDFSLKDGQTFSIKLPGGGSGRKIRDTNTSAGGLGGGGGFLPPPPPGRRG